MAILRNGVWCLWLASVFLPGSSILGQEGCGIFRRGDSNQDSNVDLSDGIQTLSWLFLGSPTPGCLDAADSNDDGQADIADAIFSFTFLFLGGPPPADPGPLDCGTDPTLDRLSCAEYVPCLAAEECSCQTNEDCADGSYCAKSEGDCAGQGTCKEKPIECPRILDPVCGCDGRTYGNDCEAAAAGVNVAYRGSCEQLACGGFIGVPCDKGYLCDLPAGACQGADLQGECVEIPEFCPENYDPVCGCDGETYSNDCERVRAGVQKAYDGQCES